MHPSNEYPDIISKECHYWDKRHHRSEEWYFSNFDYSYPCVGEITPAYAILSPRMVSRIHKLLPNITVFFIIRNPKDRTWTSIKKMIKKEKFHSTDEESMIEHARSEKTILRNDYIRTLDNWTKLYNSSQFKVIFFDDLVNRPHLVLTELAIQLGVDCTFFGKLKADDLCLKINSSSSEIINPTFEKWFDDSSSLEWSFQIEKIYNVYGSYLLLP